MSSYTDREIELAQFTHLVSLSGIETAIMEAIREAISEWADTPRLKFWTRRRLDREIDQLYRLYRAVSTYMHTQEQG